MMRLNEDDAARLVDAILAVGMPVIVVLLAIVGWFVRAKSHETDDALAALREDIKALSNSVTSDYVRLSAHTESRRELLDMIRQSRLDIDTQMDRNLATTTRLFFRMDRKRRRLEEDDSGGES